MVERPGPELLLEIRGGTVPEENADSIDALIDVLALNNEMKAFVDARINPNWRTTKRLAELRNLLFSPEFFAIEYESGNTKTTNESIIALKSIFRKLRDKTLFLFVGRSTC